MAQVTFMDGIMSIRGKLGDTIYRTTPSGKTIAYQRRQSRTSPLTEKEILQRKRFAIATRIACAVLDNPELRTVFQRKHKSITSRSCPKTLRGYVMTKVMSIIKEIDL